MSMFGHLQISGTWTNGPNKSAVGVVDDYCAGRLLVRGDAGYTSGPPSSFRSQSGQSGVEILRGLLHPPSCETLRYGATREAIAAAHSVALHGFSETRAWDGPRDYIVDTGEGAVGVVRFEAKQCFGAMVSLDPSREFSLETALGAAPSTVATLADEVINLPFLAGDHTGPVTALFWSTGKELRASEEWVSVYEFGGEILRRELLTDERWDDEAQAHYEIGPELTRAIARLAQARHTQNGPLNVGPSLFQQLVPRHGTYYSEASALLRELGVHPAAQS